jgi:hypothetical protein
MTENQGDVLAEQYWSKPRKKSKVVGKSCPRNQHRERNVIHFETWSQPTDANARRRVRMSDNDDLVLVSALK